MKALELSGKKFGHLLVLERNYDYGSGFSQKRGYWKCICDCCGKTVYASSTSLSGGLKTSCKTNHLEKGEAGFNFLFRNYKNGANLRGFEFNLTKEQFKKYTKENCFYCGSPPNQVHKKEKDIYIYNGIDRINNSKGYVEGNVVACCGTCNMAKRRMSQEEFISWINKVYNNISIKEEKIK